MAYKPASELISIPEGHSLVRVKAWTGGQNQDTDFEIFELRDSTGMVVKTFEMAHRIGYYPPHAESQTVREI